MVSFMEKRASKCQLLLSFQEAHQRSSQPPHNHTSLCTSASPKLILIGVIFISLNNPKFKMEKEKSKVLEQQLSCPTRMTFQPKIIHNETLSSHTTPLIGGSLTEYTENCTLLGVICFYCIRPLFFFLKTNHFVRRR